MVRFEPGREPCFDTPNPPGWEAENGELRCLTCRRRAVADRARAAANGDPDLLVRRAVSRAVAAFELRRTEGRIADKDAAARAGTTHLAVREIRRELIDAGELAPPPPPQPPAPRFDPDRRARTDASWRERPFATAAQVAELAGCSPRTAARRRAALEAEGAVLPRPKLQPTRRSKQTPRRAPVAERVDAELRRDSARTDAAVANALGVSRSLVSRQRRWLRAAGEPIAESKRGGRRRTA